MFCSLYLPFALLSIIFLKPLKLSFLCLKKNYAHFLSFIYSSHSPSQSGLSWAHSLNSLSPLQLIFWTYQTSCLFLSPPFPFNTCAFAHVLSLKGPAFSFLYGDLLEALNMKFKLFPKPFGSFIVFCYYVLLCMLFIPLYICVYLYSYLDVPTCPISLILLKVVSLSSLLSMQNV